MLTQLVTIVYDDRDLEEAIPAEEILERNLPKKPAAPPQATDAGPASKPVSEGPARPRGQPRAAEPLRAEGHRNGSARPVWQDRTEGSVPAAQVIDEKPAEAVGQDRGNGGEPPPEATSADQARRGRRRGRRGRRRQRRPQAEGSAGQNGADHGSGKDDSGHGEPPGPA